MYRHFLYMKEAQAMFLAAVFGDISVSNEKEDSSHRAWSVHTALYHSSQGYVSFVMCDVAQR